MWLSIIRRLGPLLAVIMLTACVSADPTLVAQAVDATWRAAPTATPIVFVVTALGGSGPAVPTVTLDAAARQTLHAATRTLAAASFTPAPASPTAAPTTSPLAAVTFTPTPSPTLLPTVTISASPSATPPPSITPLPLSALWLRDDFDESGNWPTGADEVRQITLSNGQLSITLQQSDHFAVVYNITRRTNAFLAQVTASSAACAYRDRYGLLFRLQDGNNYYRFEVDCDRRYRVARIVSGELMPLCDWTRSDFIHRGDEAPNVLAVRAVGEYLSIFANGQFLREVKDDTFADGALGLFAGSGASSTYTATFDDLRVWEIGK